MSYQDTAIRPSPLAHADWQYVEKRCLDDYRAEDWEILGRQRKQYYDEQMVDQILRMLTCQKDDPGYVYTVNNYLHCLQTATRMLRDERPEEDIVVGLLHDNRIPVASLSVARPTLDDVFIKYTGRTIRAEEATGDEISKLMGLRRR